MKRWLDWRSWPGVLWQHPVPFVAAFLLGGLITFIYSYAPLHRAKDWELSYLEERLEARDDEYAKLEDELEEATKALSGQPSNEELAALRKRLKEAEALASDRDKQVEKLERRAKAAEHSRDSYREQQAEAVAKLAACSAPSPAAPAPRDEAVGAPPAAPGDDAGPSPEAPAHDGSDAPAPNA